MRYVCLAVVTLLAVPVPMPAQGAQANALVSAWVDGFEIPTSALAEVRSARKGREDCSTRRNPLRITCSSTTDVASAAACRAAAIGRLAAGVAILAQNDIVPERNTNTSRCRNHHVTMSVTRAGRVQLTQTETSTGRVVYEKGYGGASR